MTTGYVINYWNGESHDDCWIGILEREGVYLSREAAEERIKQLQIEHDHRVKEEIEEGYIFPTAEHETWNVIPITIHS